MAEDDTSFPVTRQVCCTLTTTEVAEVERIAKAEDRDRSRQVARLIRLGLKAHKEQVRE